VAIEVQLADDLSTEVSPEPVIEWARRVILHMEQNPEQTEVCIRIVEATESARFNAGFRGIDKPTNVLSFPADVNLPGAGLRYLGDLVICDPVVRREAEEQNKNEADHLAHMVVHGMLHLYGFDHEASAEAEVMENAEREILAEAGIADPYREV
jgi:probable rRNA maturation factor